MAEHIHSGRNNVDKSERERFYWQMPNRVIESIGIRKGMVVADFGSGSGYFTRRLARYVGQTGNVYAIDSDIDELHLLIQPSDNDANNIIPVSISEMELELPSQVINVVLMVNVLHLIPDFSDISRKLRNAMKTDGTLAVVQWDAEKMSHELSDWSKKDRDLYTMRTTLKKIYETQWEVIRMEHFLPMQNIYICR